MQIDYEKLFPVLKTVKEIEVLINPFISAYQNRAKEQLEGQIASAKIGMARLSSPQLYWVLNGNDFTLDINNPEHPKILCLANNPQKQQVFGAVLSLYVNRIIKLVNQKNKTSLSERFGKIVQVKESVSINMHDTSISKSGQLDYAISSSKIASLSSEEFVGMVADDPNEKIKLKTFHSEIIDDHEALEREKRFYKELPVVAYVDPQHHY